MSEATVPSIVNALYYAQKDGCKHSGVGCGAICYNCVQETMQEHISAARVSVAGARTEQFIDHRFVTGENGIICSCGFEKPEDSTDECGSYYEHIRSLPLTPDAGKWLEEHDAHSLKMLHNAEARYIAQQVTIRDMEKAVARKRAQARRDAFEKCRTAVAATFSVMGESAKSLWELFARWTDDEAKLIEKLDTEKREGQVATPPRILYQFSYHKRIGYLPTIEQSECETLVSQGKAIKREVESESGTVTVAYELLPTS